MRLTVVWCAADAAILPGASAVTVAAVAVTAGVLVLRRYAVPLRARRRTAARMRWLVPPPRSGERWVEGRRARAAAGAGAVQAVVCPVEPPIDAVTLAPPAPLRPGAGGPGPGPGPGPEGRFAGLARRCAVAAGAGSLVAVVVGGVAGLVTGAMLACLLHRRLPTARSAEERRAAAEADELARQLPLTAELLAACLGSATAPSEAVAAVGRSLRAPMGPRLTAVAAELGLGAPPESCWKRLGEERPVLAPLARCLVRTSISGAPAAAALTALAREHRAAATRAARARVRRAGVLATAPLGLCFLPAFVLIGVVPVLVGLTGSFSGRV